ncbi:MAG: peptidoglycan DD-metalloendopeptidase family protein [Candidatus Dormibacteria bacterium]
MHHRLRALDLARRHPGWALIASGVLVLGLAGAWFWQAAQQFEPVAVTLAARATPNPPLINADWMRPRLRSGNVLGHVTVPAIGISVDIREGTDPSSLLADAGHVPSSAYPGEADNVVIFGHRNVLAALGRAATGTTVEVTTSYGSYTYTVSGHETLHSADGAPLQPTTSPTLTMATDSGSDSYLVVQATMVPASADQREQIDEEVAIAEAQRGGPGGPITSLLEPVAGSISQEFGPTTAAIELPYIYAGVYYAHFHTGLDIAAPVGTPVRAAAAGTVVLATESVEKGQLVGYGRYVLISHGGDYYTLYGHLSAITVSAGDELTAGQVLGLVGSTGRSTGPHLHFELRRGRMVLDPLPYLPGY